MRGWSKGCEACRGRRVKCDEGKPECARCLRRQETCIYREVNGMMFKCMNEELARKAAYRTPGVVVVHDAGSAINVHGDLALCTQPLLQERTLSMHKVIPAWEEYAISHFMSTGVLEPNRGRMGYLAFLPPLYIRGERDQYPARDFPLRHAILACAGTAYANVYDLPKIKTQALAHYTEALRAVQRNCADPDTAKTDESLASIVLLQLFEIVAGIQEAEADHHDEALIRLMALRSKAEQSTPIGLQLSFVIQAQRQLREFSSNRPYSAPLISNPARRIVHSALPTYSSIRQLLAQLSRTTHRIKQQLSRSNQSRPSNDNAELNDVIEQAFSMYTVVLHWPQTVQELDRYRSILNLAAESDSPAFPPVWHAFDSTQHGALWVGFWCAEIQYLQQFKLLLEAFKDERIMNARWTASLKDQITRNVSAGIDHICGIARCMLGVQCDSKAPSSLGAFFLLRGLYVAAQVDTITSEQKAFVSSQLTRIGRVHGIELALRLKERIAGL